MNAGVMLIAQHLKMVQSVRLTEAYIQLKLVQVLSTVIHSSVLILLRKSKNDGAIRRNMLFMDLVKDSFPFYMRTVQSQTGTKVTRVGSATDTQSGRSEFIFRPVPCKRIKKCMETDTNSYHEFVQVSCNYPLSPLCFTLHVNCKL